MEVANLRDEGGIERFWKKGWAFSHEAPKTVYSLRNELRHIWQGDRSESELIETLNKWANYSHPGLQGIAYRQWTVSLSPPRIIPQYANLRGYLVFAVLIYLPFLAVCENPGCPATYFVGDRRTQKYCGGECKKYAQRQYSLKNWREKGHLLRAQRQAAKKARKKPI